MINVLIFPSGSEIGLEIYNSLSNIKDIKLFGANEDSPNHGEFIYESYFGNIDSINKEKSNWIKQINDIVLKNNIDVIYPAGDDIIVLFSENIDKFKCKIIIPSKEVSLITRSKILTYKLFENIIGVPKIYEDKHFNTIIYPVFVKPEKGAGAINSFKINNYEELKFYLNKYKGLFVSEYLPGDEFTIDCFSSNSQLMYIGGRKRIKIKNGIAVHSKTYYNKEFELIANKIQNKLNLNGAWFFQLKFDKNNNLKLLEIAPRISGTMSVNRMIGINFALLSIYNIIGINIDGIITNSYEVTVDRALSNKYKLSNIEYDIIYFDLDDTIILNGKVNILAISFIFQCINEGKKIILITKNQKNLDFYLKKYKINGLFDEIIHLKKIDDKYEYIKNKKSIFIDDSYGERKIIKEKIGIPVFDLSNIECLLKFNK